MLELVLAGHQAVRAQTCEARTVRVYCVVDLELSPPFALGDSLDVCVRREDAERFVEDVRADDEELVASLRIV